MVYKSLYLIFLFLMGLTFTIQTGSIQAGETKPPLKILLDTDPGGDDAFALLWLQSLMKQKKAELIAVTTVDGNVSNQYTFTNAVKLLALGGFETIEVGRAVPIPNPPKGADYIHGQDGIGGLSPMLPDAQHLWSKACSSDEIIIEQLTKAPNEITLVAIGPLTNLAAAEEKSPGILAKAKEVVIMGGAFLYHGNVTSQAEFNIHYNPKAADIVFASREDIIVLPLDVTHKITFTRHYAHALYQENPKSLTAKFILALCDFMTETALGYRETEGLSGFLVHDAATLAYLFYPETLSFRRAEVRVETQANWTQGQTIIDERHGVKINANAWVALEVDKTNIIANLVEDLKYLVKKEKE